MTTQTPNTQTITTKIRNRIRSIPSNTVFFGTITVTVGIFTGSIFNYLLQFALARFLSVSDYGTFNAFLALINILSAPAAVLTTSLIKVTAELKAQERFDRLTQLFWRMVGVSLLLGFTISLVFIIGQGYFSASLNVADTRLFITYAFWVSTVFLLLTPLSYLQGLTRFKAFAFVSAFHGFLRFLIPVVLVALGYGLFGVFTGIAFSSILLFVTAYLLLKKNFRIYQKESLGPFYKRMLAFSVPVLLTNLGMMLLNNLDIILVKSYFSQEMAGYYAGVVTIGKVLLFGAGTVVVIMFPQISEAFAKGTSYWPKFKSFLQLQVLILAAGLLVFTLIPGLITRVMFGEKFLPAVPYVPLFSVFMGLYVLINFFVMFNLAIGRTKVFMLQVPTIIAQYLLIVLFHQNFYQVIWVNIFVSFALLVFLVIDLLVSRSHEPSKHVSLSTNPQSI
jgi:O-antigen/teichoic acid export membrane protein